MKAVTDRNIGTDEIVTTLSYSPVEGADLGRRIYEVAVNMAARDLADYIIHHHGQEIAAKVDMQAVANLTVADAAHEMKQVIHGDLKKINRTLADGLSELNEPVYERGLFGVRRVR